MTLARGCVQGTVKNEDSREMGGTVIWNAATGYTQNGQQFRILPQSTRSDSSGRFWLDGLPAGSTAIVAYAEGYLRTSQNATISPPACAKLDFVLDHASYCKILVRDSEGRPVQNAFLSGLPAHVTVKNLLRPHSDAKGIISLALPEGIEAFECIITATGFHSQLAKIDPTENSHLLNLESAKHLNGIVTSDSGPVGGAQIQIYGNMPLPKQGDIVPELCTHWPIWPKFQGNSRFRLYPQGYPARVAASATARPTTILGGCGSFRFFGACT